MTESVPTQSARVAELEAQVELLRDALEAMREAKTAELFGRTPEAWLDIEAALREAVTKGYGRAPWRKKAWKVLHG